MSAHCVFVFGFVIGGGYLLAHTASWWIITEERDKLFYDRELSVQARPDLLLRDHKDLIDSHVLDPKCLVYNE